MKKIVSSPSHTANETENWSQVPLVKISIIQGFRFRPELSFVHSKLKHANRARQSVPTRADKKNIFLISHIKKI